MERGVGPHNHFPDAYQILGPGEVRYPVSWKHLTKEQQAFQAYKVAVHAAMVDSMDRAIGRVFDQLRRMKFLVTISFFSCRIMGQALKSWCGVMVMISRPR